MRYVMPAIGLLLLYRATRGLRKNRSSSATLFFFSMVCGMIGLALWPRENALLVDRLVHVAGFSHLVTDTAISLCFVLQFAFATSLIGSWRTWHTVAVILCGALTTTMVAAWVITVRAVPEASLSHLLYDGYYASPMSLLVLNVAICLCLVGPAVVAMGTYGTFLVQDTEQDERWTAVCAMTVLGGGAVYEALVVGQLLSARAGIGITHTLWTLRGPVVLGSALLALITAWFLAFFQQVGEYARSWLSLNRLRAEIWQIRRDIIDGNVLLSDRLIQVEEDYVDPELLPDLANRCTQRRLSPFQRRVAMEAMRWITLKRANLARVPWSDARSRFTAVDHEIAIDAARQAERENYFYSDVFRIVVDVLAPSELPELSGRPKLNSWQREVANLVAEVLRDHGQLPGSHSATPGQHNSHTAHRNGKRRTDGDSQPSTYPLA